MENMFVNENQNSDFNLKEFLNKYSIQWRWFVLSVIVSLMVAFIYIRYTKTLYKAETTILVKDETKGGILSEMSAFSDMGIGSGIKSNLDNEIEILQSRTLVETTVKKMDLNITVFIKGKLVDREIYKSNSLEIQVVNRTKEYYKTNKKFKFSPLSNTSFHLEVILEKNNKSQELITNSDFNYGQPIKTNFGDLVINNTDFNRDNESFESAIITIMPLDNVVSDYKQRLKVSPLSKTSSVVSLSIIDPVKGKAEDFLNNLVQIYNENAALDKNFMSEKTSEFITERLTLITKELEGVEQEVESFKEDNNITDITSETKLFVENSAEYNKKVLELEIQKNVVESMIVFLEKTTNNDLLPANIISGETDASGLISSYNQLILNRNRILESATIENPTVVKMDQQIASLRANVMASLDRMKATLKIQKRDLFEKEGGLNKKIGKVPAREREFRVIERQQKVKEELYLYLLQKREETAISLSATDSNARVIDTALAADIPVSPKKNIIYLGAILFGLLIPFGILYVDDLLDTKIKSRLDIEGKTIIPFIGDVPTSESANQIIKAESRTSSAEALRIIRTNLEFMLGKVQDGVAKTIFLTSTFPKEGKTFISVNLAATFALSGKKVLLIGMDIRNPRLDDYLNLPDRGVTNYLSSKDLILDDLIVKQSGYEDFYVLPAGIIPPNPAELLMGKKVNQLFEKLKKEFDYIIVDTAPVGLVTDTLLITKFADCFIYVVRANVLEKRMLAIPNGLYKENKLPNMCMLLNDTDSTKGYGYGYGYGINMEVKPWYKNIFKI